MKILLHWVITYFYFLHLHKEQKCLKISLGSLFWKGVFTFVKGFGLKSGAIASTVAHDHHNIVVVGIGYEDIAVAVNRMSEIEGGFVIANKGKVACELPLPIAGLMSLEPFEKVEKDLRLMRKEAQDLGVTLQEPFLQLSFLALPVIPALKITDKGIINVKAFTIIS